LTSFLTQSINLGAANFSNALCGENDLWVSDLKSGGLSLMKLMSHLTGLCSSIFNRLLSFPVVGYTNLEPSLFVANFDSFELEAFNLFYKSSFESGS